MIRNILKLKNCGYADTGRVLVVVSDEILDHPLIFPP